MSGEQLIYLFEPVSRNSLEAAHTSLEMAVGKIPADLMYDADGDGRVTIKDAITYMQNPTATQRFCTGTGYTSQPADTPANTFYYPRISDPGVFRQSMFSPGTTGGRSTPGMGDIKCANPDGGLDALINYGFESYVLKSGYPSKALSTFTTIASGAIEQVEFAWGEITFKLRDKTAELATPLQSIKYAGSNTNGNGIEGESALKDKLKPRLFGSCYNITPVCCNSSKLIYQCNDGAVQSIPVVRDSGVILPIGQAGAYTSQADMEATAPNAGEYRVWPAGGCFRLGSSPAGAVTCDAIQGANAAARTAGQVIKQLAGEKIGPAFVTASAITALDTAAPYEIGYYTSEAVNTDAVMDLVAGSVGAWWGFDTVGYLWTKQLLLPTGGESIATLTQTQILSIDRIATADGDRGLPICKANIDYGKNFTLQSSGLAGIVTDALTFGGTGTPLTTAQQIALSTEYKRSTAIDAAVKTHYTNAGELTIPTLLTATADADAEAARILTLRSTRRDRLRVTVKMEAAPDTSLGKVVTIQYPRYGYTSGRAMRIIGSESQYMDGIITLELWG